jgi:predicted ABC-type transport system involved in lysophospholipase L1 biosynthesis ATPase subunit
VTSPPAIAARDLRLTLGKGEAAVEILRGIDLTVATGETLALLGPSGSGKSSLMAVLSGLERASSGSVHVAGAEFEALDEDALARARRGRIGIVLQAFHLLPTMTAQENVATPLELAGRARRLGPRRGGARSRRPRPSPDALPGAAFGRRAAASRHRPRDRPAPAAGLCRRADRQP